MQTERIKNALKACQKLHARPITAELFARHYKPVMPHGESKRISVYSAADLLKELCADGYLIKIARGQWMVKNGY